MSVHPAPVGATTLVLRTLPSLWPLGNRCLITLSEYHCSQATNLPAVPYLLWHWFLAPGPDSQDSGGLPLPSVSRFLPPAHLPRSQLHSPVCAFSHVVSLSGLPASLPRPPWLSRTANISPNLRLKSVPSVESCSFMSYLWMNKQPPRQKPHLSSEAFLESFPFSVSS